jgi:hypothetical protein
MHKDGFKLLEGHSPDCFCRDKLDEAFVSHGGFTNRAKNGRKGGSWSWHVFRCNDPKCPAEMGVRWDVMARTLDEGL